MDAGESEGLEGVNVAGEVQSFAQLRQVDPAEEEVPTTVGAPEDEAEVAAGQHDERPRTSVVL